MTPLQQRIERHQAESLDREYEAPMADPLAERWFDGPSGLSVAAIVVLLCAFGYCYRVPISVAVAALLGRFR